jgi:antitoxin MazE
MIRTRIIKIGNSQGIRIPKVLLEQSGLDAEVEIGVRGEEVIIRKAPNCEKAGITPLLSLCYDGQAAE